MLIAWSGAAWAQTSSPPAAPAGPSLAPVTITGSNPERGYKADESGALGVPLPTQQLPATVNIIGAEFLRDFNIKSLTGLANYVPGVTIDDNGGGTGESLLIRGFTTETIYVDGLRSSARYGIQRSLSDTLERVEIIKGPAGAEFGTTEFGGAVNLVTKKPRAVFAAEASAAIGDFGYRKTAFDITGALNASKTLQGRLVAAYEENAEWRKGRPDKTPRYVIAPSLNLDYSNQGSVLLQI